MTEAGKAEEEGEQGGSGRCGSGSDRGLPAAGASRGEGAAGLEATLGSLPKGPCDQRAFTVETRDVTDAAEDSASGIK